MVALIPASKASAAEDTSLRTFPTAEEMAEYTQQNVLNQAAVSVLAQANELPQQVLSLLK